MEKLMQTYYKKLENYFWDYLVPPSGQAETAQGEIIRIAGRIQHEMLDNGCMNWDEDFKICRTRR